MEETIRLFSYKMTHDTGFAPNPFHGIITLSCCKPGIRKTKQIGDWIAGFTSKTLIHNHNSYAKKHGSKKYKKFDEEELVFLMRVEKKLTFDEFWNNPDFEYKRFTEESKIAKRGDNIYFANSDLSHGYEQVTNNNHKEKDRERDLSGVYILASKNFYYFGVNSLKLDPTIAPKIPRTQTCYGIRTHDESKIKVFIDYIQNSYSPGIHGHPFLWPDTDETWRNYEGYFK